MSQSCNTKPAGGTLKERMKTWTFWKTIVFVFLGGVAGYLYYHFIGCSGGSCAITGNPYASVGFGSLLGLWITNRPCAC